MQSPPNQKKTDAQRARDAKKRNKYKQRKKQTGADAKSSFHSENLADASLLSNDESKRTESEFDSDEQFDLTDIFEIISRPNGYKILKEEFFDDTSDETLNYFFRLTCDNLPFLNQHLKLLEFFITNYEARLDLNSLSDAHPLNPLAMLAIIYPVNDEDLSETVQCKIAAINLLIKHGANVNLPSGRGQLIPIHYALMKSQGNLGVVHCLLDHKSDLIMEDGAQMSALYHAILGGLNTLALQSILNKSVHDLFSLKVCYQWLIILKGKSLEYIASILQQYEAILQSKIEALSSNTSSNKLADEKVNAAALVRINSYKEYFITELIASIDSLDSFAFSSVLTFIDNYFSDEYDEIIKEMIHYALEYPSPQVVKLFLQENVVDLSTFKMLINRLTLLHQQSPGDPDLQKSFDLTREEFQKRFKLFASMIQVNSNIGKITKEESLKLANLLENYSAERKQYENRRQAFSDFISIHKDTLEFKNHEIQKKLKNLTDKIATFEAKIHRNLTFDTDQEINSFIELSLNIEEITNIQLEEFAKFNIRFDKKIGQMKKFSKEIEDTVASIKQTLREAEKARRKPKQKLKPDIAGKNEPNKPQPTPQNISADKKKSDKSEDNRDDKKQEQKKILPQNPTSATCPGIRQKERARQIFEDEENKRIQEELRQIEKVYEDKNKAKLLAEEAQQVAINRAVVNSVLQEMVNTIVNKNEAELQLRRLLSLDATERKNIQQANEIKNIQQKNDDAKIWIPNFAETSMSWPRIRIQNPFQIRIVDDIKENETLRLYHQGKARLNNHAVMEYLRSQDAVIVYDMYRPKNSDPDTPSTLNACLGGSVTIGTISHAEAPAGLQAEADQFKLREIEKGMRAKELEQKENEQWKKDERAIAEKQKSEAERQQSEAERQQREQEQNEKLDAQIDKINKQVKQMQISPQSATHPNLSPQSTNSPRLPLLPLKESVSTHFFPQPQFESPFSPYQPHINQQISTFVPATSPTQTIGMFACTNPIPPTIFNNFPNGTVFLDKQGRVWTYLNI